MKFLVKLYLKMFAVNVGHDIHGNLYFESKQKDCFGRKERFCFYNGRAEASKIPAEWHAWMHHQKVHISTTGITHVKRGWQKNHIQTLTGTKYRYLPENHPLYDKSHDLHQCESQSSALKYKSWSPE